MAIHPKFSGAGIGGRAKTKAFQGMIGAAVAALAGAMPVLAQQADSAPPPVAQTPPELRDFRLDPPPTPQGPEQRPAPREERPSAPAPAESSVAAPSPSSPEPPRAVPTRPNAPPPEQRTPDATAEASRRVEAPAAPPQADTPGEASPDAAMAPPPAPASSRNSALPDDPASNAEPDWRWLALLIALLAGSGAFVLWRRWARPEPAAPPQSVAAPLSPPRRPQPKSVAPMPPAKSPPIADASPALTAGFTAESAQLSIASLTVTGTLSIANQGAEPIPAVQLRSLMISAQEGQEETAASFHAGAMAGDAQMIGDLAPGERINARIEFRLPREELAAFRWSEREFVAPILLINVRSDGTPATEVRLSQLIGRATDAPAGRLKPLAIDRGPRRFQPIAARPVFGQA